MAEKDLDRRGKGSEEVAYFVPKFAQSYVCFGMMGHHYSFDKANPVKVELSSDIIMFRSKADIEECDANGNPLAEEEGVKPLSYAKTAPPEPTPLEQKGKSEVLTTDKPKKKTSKKEEDGDKESAKKEQGGKKKKKSAPKTSKKVSEPEPDEDDEDEDEEDGDTTEILGLNVSADNDEDDED